MGLYLDPRHYRLIYCLTELTEGGVVWYVADVDFLDLPCTVFTLTSSSTTCVFHTVVFRMHCM